MNAFTKMVAAVALIASGTAHAQQVASVAINDIDLATSNGQKILALRIHRAARSLCESEAITQSPKVMRAERTCIANAKQAAFASVEHRKAAQLAKR